MWTKAPLEAVPPIFKDSRPEQKQPVYAAFSGASGSGKTFAMVWTCYKVVKHQVPAGRKDLTFYLSCRPGDQQDPFDYVDSSLTEKVSQLGSPFKLDDFRKQCAATWLILILDEVPWRWTHELYRNAPERLKRNHGFDRVVMLVGGTVLSHDVRRQPTSSFQVVNIRMKPVGEKQMSVLLSKHLSKLCGMNSNEMSTLR